MKGIEAVYSDAILHSDTITDVSNEDPNEKSIQHVLTE